MATGVQQTIQFAPWTRMLMENAISPFWGEGQGVPMCHRHPHPSPRSTSTHSLPAGGGWPPGGVTRGRALNRPLPLTCSSSQKKFLLHFNPRERTWQWLWTVAVLSWFSLSPLGKRRLHVCGHGQKRSEVELKLPTRGYRWAELGHTQSWSHDQVAAWPWDPQQS